MNLLLRALVPLLMSSVFVGTAQATLREEQWATAAVAQRPAGGVRVWLPAAYEPASYVPVAVILGERHDDLTRALVERGFVVAAPMPGELRAAFAELRRRCRIEQGGLHAVFAAGGPGIVPLALDHRVEFQTFTAYGDVAKVDVAPLRRLPARRVRTVAGTEVAAVAAMVQQLHAERALLGTGAEVARALDAFHDAATVGDARRYFALLPDDALFLGTDGTERWTGAEFRREFTQYFERGSAWTYVCLQRHVDVDLDGAFAWFDETFDNAAYGECRGSGVVSKRDGNWVLRQYHLTVPVPNDVTRGVAARIRAFQDGQAAGATTVVVVRHGEKTGPEADELSELGKQRAASLASALRDVPITGIYTSEYRRTAETVAAVAAARGLDVKQMRARDAKALAARIVAEQAGRTALVCGHSNTVPELLKALGVKDEVKIADDEYDRMFVVTLEPEGARLLALRYATGAAPK
jgi:phosphohistidine phosphatase SixA/ketosteroid isomerase-like protein